MIRRGLLAGLLLIALGVMQSAPGGPAAAVTSIQGDVNCSGGVNAVDSLQVLRSVAGLSTTAACLAEAGNTNCDPAINAVDALRILRHVAGLTNSLPAGCVAIGESLAPPPTSEELIAEALAAATITYEESLLYRALALYDLPGLPEEFRSPVIDYHAGRLLFVEIEDNKAQLGQATLDALEPILARPNDPISVFNNPPVAAGAAAAQTAGYWTSTTAAAGKVRVWVRTDWNPDPSDLAAYAQAATLVWPKLEQVFGLPTPDQVTTQWILENPDNAIDIYMMTTVGVDPRMSACLTHPGTADCRFGTGNGETRPWGPWSGDTSSGYVMLQNTFSGDELIRLVAHELAHVVQNKYDRHENYWLSDSTADWVAFRVLQEHSPTNRTTLYERAHEAVFDNPTKRLERDEGWSRYGAWLYFFFASQNSGDAIVRSVWQNAAAGGVQGIQAADQAIPFNTNFDDFTLRNWNQKPPLTKEYKEADSTFPAYIPKTKPWFFALSDERTEADPISQLSSVYYRYTFNSPIRKITINNLVAGNPDLRVWALVKIGDDWKPPEDWSSKTKEVFCRTLPAQNVTDLVIIVSNSNVTNAIPATDKIKVETKVTGCVGWVGTASGVSTWQCCAAAGGLSSAAASQILEAHTTANILWEEDPLFFYGCTCVAFFPVGTIDWSVYYHVESESGSCSETPSGQVQAGAGLSYVTEQMMIRWDDPNNPDRYFYSGGGWVPVDALLNCDGPPGFTYQVTDFFSVPTPNIELPTATPTLPPTPPPMISPTTIPAPAPGIAPMVSGGGNVAAVSMCDDLVFAFPRNATTFSGSCFRSYTDSFNYERFDWSFTRVEVVQP